LEATVSNPRVPIKFDIYRGDQLVRTEAFDEPIIKIGKVASSHLRLDDDLTSRMHAMIEVTGPDEVYIIDLGSASGTFVNGQKSTKARLQSGDQITIGETTIVIEVGADFGAGDDEATMAVDRAQTGLDFGAMAAEHADASLPPPGAYVAEQAPTAERAAPRAGVKGTLVGMPMNPPGGMAPGAGGFPAARPSVPPGFAPPPAMGAPGAGLPNPFANPFANPGGAPAAGVPAPGQYGQPPAAYGQAPGGYAQAPGGYAQAPAYAAPVSHGGGHGHGHDDEEDPERVRYGLVASGPPVNPDDVETSDRALEVMIMWGDNSVLSVEHVSPIRSYYVGESTDAKGKPTVDYLLGSDLLGTERMPVVIDAGGGGAVVIPPGATGDITVGNDRMAIQDLVASGRVQPCNEMAGAYQYPLPAGATARVQFRGLTFVVRPVNAGRAVGVGGARSGTNFKEYGWTVLSFAIHALFLLMMYFMPPGGSALSLDLLNEDSRLAKYLMEPPETIEEETPDWLQNSETPDDEGGKGKRHKDEEGQMGKEESKQTKNKYAIEGPADNEDPQMAREQAKEQAATAGILGVLSASTGAFNSPTSPYGADTALGYDPMSALGALMGDQIGENFGFGGLGLRGTGRGGGGTGEGTIGLGNVGTIGHGGGGGSGSGYGRGAGGFRGRDAKVPRIRSGNADVRGSLSKEVIRRVIQRHINEVRFCYEQELNQRPDLSGRVQVKFIISPSGAVQASNVENSTLGSARADQCIAQAVRRWTFPAPDGGGIVVVSYPFVLEAAGN
jgi:TonB family protein